jgi:hypothetical protein
MNPLNGKGENETVNNSQREEKTIESDLVSLIESLKESGFVTFTNKSGDIISVKGMLTDVIKRIQQTDSQPLVHKEETQEEWISVKTPPDTDRTVLCYGFGDRYFTAIYNKERNVFEAYDALHECAEDCEMVGLWKEIKRPTDEELTKNNL